MIQRQLYKKDVTLNFNPAVSVTNINPNVIETEIDEYVFTAENVNGLYDIMNAIRCKSTSHNGIWISGYYGSGKSHLLKYMGFCLDAKYRDKALDRLMEAAEIMDPFGKNPIRSNVDVGEMRILVNWLRTSDINPIIFNVGDSIGDKVELDKTFVKALWKELNVFRGYNRFNLSLAYFLEEPLDKKGKMDDFKAAIEEEGFDWNVDAQQLADSELDLVMDVAHRVVPEFSIDMIRKNIFEQAINLSVEQFCDEIRGFLADKDKNYRLVFFIDEVSQFIGTKKELLLQLQQIATRINECSDGRVWVGCTAQQDLSELMSNCQIRESDDDYGKIMGRFEKQLQLQGANTTYITQKRILDKTDAAAIELGHLYDEKKSAVAAQFTLPAGFDSYKDKEDFILNYPFVPYQFQLIMHVFDQFVKLDYVSTETKGNERSVLKITHNTARNLCENPVGQFVAFDQFFGTMFEAGLKNAGRRAIQYGEKIAGEHTDSSFAKRILHILFMLCNLEATVQKRFPATVENIVTLLMTDVDENKLDLKNRAEAILEYFVKKSVIRVQKGTPDVFVFLSEDETLVDSLIKTQPKDTTRWSEELQKVFSKYCNVTDRKFTQNGSVFSVGWSIYGREFFSQSNPDLKVEFIIDALDEPKNTIVFRNEKKRMLVFITDEYNKNTKLRDDFWYYCQVQSYLKSSAGNANSEARDRTNREVAKRAQELYEKSIVPGLRACFDKADIALGSSPLQPGFLTNKTGADRYSEALRLLFCQVYDQAGLVVAASVPKTAEELRAKLRRAIAPNEYTAKPMSPAEDAVNNKLTMIGRDMDLNELVNTYKGVPYGWSEFATLYIADELVRRHLRSYRYKGDNNIERSRIPELILKDRASFTICTAQTIDAGLINQFIDGWKDVFSTVETLPHDGEELFTFCRENDRSPLNKYLALFSTCAAKLTAAKATGLADELNKAVDKLRDWRSERDAKTFFETVKNTREEARKMMDRSKQIVSFCDDQLELYKTVREFVEDNRDDFGYLSSEYAKSIEDIKKIETDAWPIDTMKDYGKLRRVLSDAINTVRDEQKAAIKKVYSDIYPFLQDMEKKRGVKDSILPDFDNVVKDAQAADSISALRLNATVNAESFKSTWLEMIITAAAPSGEGPVSTPKLKRVAVKSVCHSTTIKNWDDIEAYLENIRKSLRDELTDNDEIILF